MKKKKKMFAKSFLYGMIVLNVFIENREYS